MNARVPAPWEPLLQAFHELGTIHGVNKNYPNGYCFISAEQRQAVIDALNTSTTVETRICTGCGTARPLSYFKALGLKSCCPAWSRQADPPITHRWR